MRRPLLIRLERKTYLSIRLTVLRKQLWTMQLAVPSASLERRPKSYVDTAKHRETRLSTVACRSLHLLHHLLSRDKKDAHRPKSIHLLLLPKEPNRLLPRRVLLGAAIMIQRHKPSHPWRSLHRCPRAEHCLLEHRPLERNPKTRSLRRHLLHLVSGVLPRARSKAKVLLLHLGPVPKEGLVACHCWGMLPCSLQLRPPKRPTEKMIRPNHQTTTRSSPNSTKNTSQRMCIASVNFSKNIRMTCLECLLSLPKSTTQRTRWKASVTNLPLVSPPPHLEVEHRLVTRDPLWVLLLSRVLRLHPRRHLQRCRHRIQQQRSRLHLEAPPHLHLCSETPCLPQSEAPLLLMVALPSGLSEGTHLPLHLALE
mmetsp:Transcript_1792/g.3485  ORF Transcript_1792/g.3485 Transcript_1792/m.3485 type:complete len:367 (+) Transcript_1792:1319-2419(+)